MRLSLRSRYIGRSINDRCLWNLPPLWDNRLFGQQRENQDLPVLLKPQAPRDSAFYRKAGRRALLQAPSGAGGDSRENVEAQNMTWGGTPWMRRLDVDTWNPGFFGSFWETKMRLFPEGDRAFLIQRIILLEREVWRVRRARK